MDKKRGIGDDNPYSIKAKKVETANKRVFVKKPLLAIDAYTKHKMLINQYILDRKGATKALERDTSNDKTDLDILKSNHKFLWDEDDQMDTWEKRVAKKYYDKLFKEYCIADLRRYKENKIALRWRIEKEVVDGKGQFICADVNCRTKDLLKSWEVNFAYMEHGEKKNALVKIRLCPDCSYKLNYHHKRKEIKKSRAEKQKRTVKQEEDGKNSDLSHEQGPSTSNQTSDIDYSQVKVKEEEDGDDVNIWSSNKPQIPEAEPNIESEMDEYLSELFM